jgi:hypothetical protein
VINSSQGPLPDRTQYSQETNIHAHGGIRTHNLGKRAAADPHVIPRDYWDWHFKLMSIDKTTTHKLRALKASLATNTSTFSVPHHLHSFTSSFHESFDTFSFHFPIVRSSTEESRNVHTSCYVPSRHRREAQVRVQLYPYSNWSLERDGQSKSRAGPFTSGKVTRYPLYRKLGGPRGRAGCFRKISPPTRFPAQDRPASNQPPYRLHCPGQTHRQCRHRQFATYCH